MDLKQLLEYQNLDRELFNMEKEFRESPEVERFLTLQIKLKEYFQTILKLDKETEEIFQNFRKKKEITDSTVEQNGRIMQAYDSESNLEKLGAVEEELTRLERALTNADRDLSSMQKRLVSILDHYDKYYGAALDVNKKLKEAGKNRDAKRAELLKSAEPVQTALKNVRDSLPPEVLAAYQDVRKRKIMPAVVPFYKDGGSCGGCGMEILHEVENSFDANGLAECPNCGRLLYKD